RRGRNDLAVKLASYLERVGVAPLDSIERHGYVIPLAPRRGGVARDRVLLVGDAAGLADPLTAEGISNALLSGKLAARAILESNGAIERAAGVYRRSVHRRIERELFWARQLARLLHGRLTREQLFERFGHELTRAMAQVIA